MKVMEKKMEKVHPKPNITGVKISKKMTENCIVKHPVNPGRDFVVHPKSSYHLGLLSGLKT